MGAACPALASIVSGLAADSVDAGLRHDLELTFGRQLAGDAV